MSRTSFFKKVLFTLVTFIGYFLLTSNTSLSSSEIPLKKSIVGNYESGEETRNISSIPFCVYLHNDYIMIQRSDFSYNWEIKITNTSTGEYILYEMSSNEIENCITISLSTMSIGEYYVTITNVDKGYYYYGYFTL